jgi:hypothetical protein
MEAVSGMRVASRAIVYTKTCLPSTINYSKISDLSKSSPATRTYPDNRFYSLVSHAITRSNQWKLIPQNAWMRLFASFSVLTSDETNSDETI